MKRDWFVDAFGHPIADARAKLIDEGWFGRKTSEPQRDTDLGWFRADHSTPSASDPSAREPSAPEPDHDHGIDR